MVRALRTAYLEQNEISHNRDHTNGILRTVYRRYPLHMGYNVIKIMTNLEKTNDFLAVNCDRHQSLYSNGSQLMVCGLPMFRRRHTSRFWRKSYVAPHEKVIVIVIIGLTEMLKMVLNQQ